jgi:hypothetical protein
MTMATSGMRGRSLAGVVRVATAFALGIGMTGCVWNGCPIGDTECSDGVAFAAEHVPGGINPVATPTSCDPFLTNRGGIEPDRCWLVEFALIGEESGAVAFVVWTTRAAYVLFGAPQPAAL